MRPRRNLSAAVVLDVGLMAAAAAALMIAFAPVETRGAEPRTLQLVVVLDGLRPDYVIPRLMPRLSRLADDGVRFAKHHSVFPTVTRVNASSIATGAYPERHGLLGNAVFFPRVDPTTGLDTSNRDHLLRIQESEATPPRCTRPRLDLQRRGTDRTRRELRLDRLGVSAQPSRR